LSFDILSLMLYGDAATTGYVYEEVSPDLESTDIKPGAIGLVKGLGTGTGLMGKIARVFNYRIEYRFILDYYEPGLINYMWDNRRLGYVTELQQILIGQSDPSYENTTSAGIFIKGGLILLKKLECGVGYENYKKTIGGTEETINKASMYVDISKGLIPKVYGTLAYNRNDNLENIFKEMFDENTVLDANVFYELSTMIALSVQYKRTFKYNDITGEYDPIDSFGISTNFSF